MLTIGFIVGSLAPASINRKLSRVLVNHAPERVQMNEIDITELPLYDRHMDDDFPQVMSHFKDQVAAVDGLLLITPEHNQAYPAAVKNALDILTRGGSSQLKGLPMGIVGASPSRFGTINSQGQLHQFLPRLGVRLMGTPVFALQVGEGTFPEDGVADESTSKRALRYMEAFATFVAVER
jgi:chromate reductase